MGRDEMRQSEVRWEEMRSFEIRWDKLRRERTKRDETNWKEKRQWNETAKRREDVLRRGEVGECCFGVSVLFFRKRWVLVCLSFPLWLLQLFPPISPCRRPQHHTNLYYMASSPACHYTAHFRHSMCCFQTNLHTHTHNPHYSERKMQSFL